MIETQEMWEAVSRFVVAKVLPDGRLQATGKVTPYPHLFQLYGAGWKAGFTVNGIRPGTFV